MRSAVLSFTLLTAFAVTPAMAQMQQGYGAPPGETAPPVGTEMVPAPPSHQPMSHHATNLNQQTARSVISPSLPQPPVGPDADATAYLRAAQNALSQNRTGEAQSALENAETYLLNRSVPQGMVNRPDQSPAVQDISAALQGLANRDRGAAMEAIQRAIPHAQRYEAMLRQRGMEAGGRSGGSYGANGYQPGTGMEPAANNEYRAGMNGNGYQPGPGMQQPMQQPMMNGNPGGYPPGSQPGGSYGAPPPR